MRLFAQLNFGGNCEEAFRFYEKHLGGKIVMMMKQSEAPGAPRDAGKAIIHARIDIGDTVLTGNDVPPLQETFFATRFSQLRDRFGVLWSTIHERPRS